MKIKNILSGALAALMVLSLSMPAFASNYNPITSTVEKEEDYYSAGVEIEIPKSDYPELYDIENWDKGITLKYNVTIDGENSSALKFIPRIEVLNEEGGCIDSISSFDISLGETIEVEISFEELFFSYEEPLEELHKLGFYISLSDDCEDCDLLLFDGETFIIEVESIVIEDEDIEGPFNKMSGECKTTLVEEGLPKIEYEFKKEDYPALFDANNYNKGMTIEFTLTANGKKIIINENNDGYSHAYRSIALKSANMAGNEQWDIDYMPEGLYSIAFKDYDDDDYSYDEDYDANDDYYVTHIGVYFVTLQLEDYLGQDISLEVTNIKINQEDKVTPPITSGGVSTWDNKDGESIKIVIDADFDTYKDDIKVVIDGKTLELDVDYKIIEGSIIIELLPDFLKTLGNGDYDVNVSLKDEVVTAKLTVENSSVVADDNNNGDGDGDDDNNGDADGGDDNNGDADGGDDNNGDADGDDDNDGDTDGDNDNDGDTDGDKDETPKEKNPTTGVGGMAASGGLSALALAGYAISRKRR